jgi:hypothetical protein
MKKIWCTYNNNEITTDAFEGRIASDNGTGVYKDVWFE